MDKKVQLAIGAVAAAAVIGGGIWGLFQVKNILSDKKAIDSQVSEGLDENAQQTVSGGNLAQRYKETIMPSIHLENENYIANFSKSDGKVHYMTSEITEDGQTYSIIDIRTQETLYSFVVPTSSADNILVMNYSIDVNGDVFILYYDILKKSFFLQRNPQSLAPKSDDLQLPNMIYADLPIFTTAKKMLIDNEYIYIYSLIGKENGDNDYAFQIFNREGKEAYKCEGKAFSKIDGDSQQASNALSDLVIDNKGHVFLLFANQKLEKISAQSGESVWTIDLPEKNFNLIYEEAFGGLFTANLNKLSGIDSETGLANGQLINLNQATASTYDEMALEGKFRQDLAIDSKGFLYMAYTFLDSSQKGSCQHYVYEPLAENQAINENELIFTVPYKDDFLVEAISRYSRKYPEKAVNLEYTYGTRQEFLAHSNQYGDQLRTRILADDVGSLIQTGGSGLAYDQLFKTDVFTDLKPFLESDSSYDDLNKAALNGIEIDSAIRGLPISVGCQSLEINGNVAKELGITADNTNSTWGELLALSKKLESEGSDIAVFCGETGYTNVESLFNAFLSANLMDLVDFEGKQINLAQPWFLELLEEWAEAKNNPNFFRSFTYDTGSILRTTLEPRSLLALNTTGRMLGGKYELLGINQKLSGENGLPFSRIPMICGEKNNNRQGFSFQLYSILETVPEEEKSDSWQFLSFLLSAEMQKSEQISGIALNLAAEKSYFNDKLTLGAEIMPELYQEMEPIYKSIDYLYSPTGYLGDFAPLTDFLNGKLTLDESIKLAEENLWIRINE